MRVIFQHTNESIARNKLAYNGTQIKNILDYGLSVRNLHFFIGSSAFLPRHEIFAKLKYFDFLLLCKVLKSP